MHSVAWWPSVAVLAVATFTDLRTRRIPNWLVLPFLVLGIAVSCIMGGWHGLQQSVFGFAAGAFVFGLLYAAGGMGMGDVKLFAGVGAWVGPSQLLVALLFTSIIGGIMALCWAVRGRFLGELMSGTGDLICSLPKRGLRRHPELVLSNPATRKMPYAPAIAIGTLMSFFSH
jgi:prepilin peptidase CpaA